MTAKRHLYRTPTHELLITCSYDKFGERDSSPRYHSVLARSDPICASNASTPATVMALTVSDGEVLNRAGFALSS